MKAQFFIDGKSYPVVTVGKRFVVCLPEGDFETTDAVVMPYSVTRTAQFLHEREGEKR